MANKTPLGDIIMGIALLAGIVLFVISFKDVRIYAPDTFWWGLALIAASGVYFAAREAGWFNIV